MIDIVKTEKRKTESLSLEKASQTSAAIKNMPKTLGSQKIEDNLILKNNYMSGWKLVHFPGIGVYQK